MAWGESRVLVTDRHITGYDDNDYLKNLYCFVSTCGNEYGIGKGRAIAGKTLDGWNGARSVRGLNHLGFEI